MQDKAAVRHKFWAIVILLSIIAATAVLRSRLLEVPLDRDEGGYAYTAQLIIDGIPPFAGAYDMKMPGLYYVYALILLTFGQSIAGIHLGLLVINAITIAIVYFIGKHLFDTKVGLAAAAAYGVMSLSQSVLGFSANAEHLLLVPAMGGILLLLIGVDSRAQHIFFWERPLFGDGIYYKTSGNIFCRLCGVLSFLIVCEEFANKQKCSHTAIPFIFAWTDNALFFAVPVFLEHWAIRQILVLAICISARICFTDIFS